MFHTHMSQTPRLLVVTAVPVNDRANHTLRWTILLFLAHAAQFIYRLVSIDFENSTDDGEMVLPLMFGFFVCGVYLPLALYKNVRNKNTRMTRLFVVLLMIISLVSFANCLSTVCAYFELQNVCQDCAQEFLLNNGTCDMTFDTIDGAQTLELSQTECQSLPSLASVTIRYALELCTAMIGFITACKLTSPEHTQRKQYAEVMSPDEVSIVQINGQPVVVQSVRVPEIDQV